MWGILLQCPGCSVSNVVNPYKKLINEAISIFWVHQLNARRAYRMAELLHSLIAWEAYKSTGAPSSSTSYFQHSLLQICTLEANSCCCKYLRPCHSCGWSTLSSMPSALVWPNLHGHEPVNRWSLTLCLSNKMKIEGERETQWLVARYWVSFALTDVSYALVSIRVTKRNFGVSHR